jgi:hypothetical protein
MNTKQPDQIHLEIQNRYLAKVNALVGSDREHLIADITAEYAVLIDHDARLTGCRAAPSDR